MMTDSAVNSWVTLAGVVITGVFTLLNNILARRNSRDIQISKRDISDTKDAIVTLEKNTNSIKDALVKTTGEKEYAAGLLEGAGRVITQTGPTGETGPAGPRGPQGVPGQ